MVVIHPLGQRAERHLFVPERGHDAEQMRQRPPEPIQLPDHKYVAGANELEGLSQTRAVMLHAGGVILKQVSCIDAGP